LWELWLLQWDPMQNVVNLHPTIILPQVSICSCDKMCDFIHDSTESRVIGTPISRIRVTRKRRPRDAKPTSQSVFTTTLAK
jgi:hypothetical protein